VTDLHAWHTCPLCGGRFEEQPARCRGCPVAIGCETVCCPHCEYRFVTGSRVLGLLHRLFVRTRKEAP
jgi:hypothetical protein